MLGPTRARIQVQEPSDETSLGSLRNRVLRAFKWSVAAEIGSRGLQPLASIVLARILVPADFGVIAAASVVISLAQLIQEFGFSKTVIQTETEPDAFANNAFWASLSMSIPLFVGIATFSPKLAELLGTPESASVLRILSIQLVISSLYSVHAALFQRNADFRKVFLARIAGAFFPAGVSLAMAVAGWGVWALVGGSITGSVVQLAMYWKLSSWRPRMHVDLRVWRRMARFSKWITVEGLASWAIMWGDLVVLAYYMNTADLGRYRGGTLFVVFLSNVCFTPAVPVAYSWLARLQGNLVEFRDDFVKLSTLLSAVILPVGAMSALFAEPITTLIFGAKWHGTGIVIATMSLRWSLGCVVGLNSVAFTALGRPDLNVKLLLIVALVTVPVYVIAAPFGLVAFCVARLATAQIDNLLNYIVAVRVLKLRPLYLWNSLGSVIIATVIASAIAALLLRAFAIETVGELVMAGVFTTSLYAAALYLLDAPLVTWGAKYVRRAMA